MSSVFIIAEAGVNHNGDISLARQMVEVAKECGADAIKFQTFVAEKLVSKFAKKAEYQKRHTKEDETQLNMLKKLELDYSSHKELFEYCNRVGIQMLSSPFDPESIDLLDELGMPLFKVPSGELTNLPYLQRMATKGKQIIMSTGMADLIEVGASIHVIEETGLSRDNIILLHTNTEYPTPMEDVNLRAMITLKDTFKIRVGYSDHTLGIEVPVAAVAMGAEVIEKHFTLDKNMQGPDHLSSLDPEELKRMVTCIRNIELALGDGKKQPSKSEIKNIPVVRKSIVAKCKINKGELFSMDNITVKRPGHGISPMRWNDVIGKPAPRNFEGDELIEL